MTKCVDHTTCIQSSTIVSQAQVFEDDLYNITRDSEELLHLQVIRNYNEHHAPFFFDASIRSLFVIHFGVEKMTRSLYIVRRFIDKHDLLCLAKNI